MAMVYFEIKIGNLLIWNWIPRHHAAAPCTLHSWVLACIHERIICRSETNDNDTNVSHRDVNVSMTTLAGLGHLTYVYVSKTEYVLVKAFRFFGSLKTHFLGWRRSHHDKRQKIGGQYHIISIRVLEFCKQRCLELSYNRLLLACSGQDDMS